MVSLQKFGYKAGDLVKSARGHVYEVAGAPFTAVDGWTTMHASSYEDNKIVELYVPMVTRY